MKNLKRSIDKKTLNIGPLSKQKVGSQLTDWLKRNPEFQRSVVAIGMKNKQGRKVKVRQ